MDLSQLPDNPYLLLTPGPLSTTKTVKAAMLKDWCTWDDSYNTIVQEVRRRLISLTGKYSERYTSVLMQGSGTFSVEAMIGSALPKNGKLLCIANGAYGNRIIQTANVLGIDTVIQDSTELDEVDLSLVGRNLQDNPDITHVIVVHCETTTGMLNPIKEIAQISKEAGKIVMVDAMSSFGGIDMDLGELQIDFLVSSANKCIQGVPGFGFIIATKEAIASCKGNARSLSLDVYDQWETMEKANGKWRFTSPTHVVRAFYQALMELEEEGGPVAREKRYTNNQRQLVAGMKELGFETVLDERNHSPIITGFLSPTSEEYDFKSFYESMKVKGYVIYPGKVTNLDSFRIGNIGDVHAADIQGLLKAVEESMSWMQLAES
ncbi:MAG: 2-aminoethylphosphonate--pyruvate transaminase [Lentisphaerales bacterium]|nr:2-aminoethylphosphonate--pyruvate transaminase [Lentisphaerales bacterium]